MQRKVFRNGVEIRIDLGAGKAQISPGVHLGEGCRKVATGNGTRVPLIGASARKTYA